MQMPPPFFQFSLTGFFSPFFSLFVSVHLHLPFCLSLSFFLSICVCLSVCLSLLSESLFLSGCLNFYRPTCLDQQQQHINNSKIKLSQNIANDQESLHLSFTYKL